jgi:nucleotide-binding universal stress UspA family protein
MGVLDMKPTFSENELKGSDPILGAAFGNVAVFVDGSVHAHDVFSHAAAASAMLKVPLRAIRVLESASDLTTLHDPVTWDLRRNEAAAQLKNLAADFNKDTDTVMEVIVGPVSERISSYLIEHDIDLCVLGSAGEGTSSTHGIGSTARRIVDNAPCSVLLVPPRQRIGHFDEVPDKESGLTKYRRLLVPLDCSHRAETALPIAVSLGDVFGAEIILAHAVPQVGMTATGPLDEADVALRDKLTIRNEKTAKRYLGQMRSRLATPQRPVRTLLLRSGDARHMLVRAAIDEAVDLIVLSAKGASGHPDQSLGSVAQHLITHVREPILIVRSGPNRKTELINSGAGALNGNDSSLTIHA